MRKNYLLGTSLLSPVLPHKKPCTGLATPKAFCFSYMGVAETTHTKPCALKFSGLV